MFAFAQRKWALKVTSWSEAPFIPILRILDSQVYISFFKLNGVISIRCPFYLNTEYEVTKTSEQIVLLPEVKQQSTFSQKHKVGNNSINANFLFPYISNFFPLFKSKNVSKCDATFKGCKLYCSFQF